MKYKYRNLFAAITLSGVLAFTGCAAADGAARVGNRAINRAATYTATANNDRYADRYVKDRYAYDLGRDGIASTRTADRYSGSSRNVTRGLNRLDGAAPNVHRSTVQNRSAVNNTARSAGFMQQGTDYYNTTANNYNTRGNLAEGHTNNMTANRRTYAGNTANTAGNVTRGVNRNMGTVGNAGQAGQTGRGLTNPSVTARTLPADTAGIPEALPGGSKISRGQTPEVSKQVSRQGKDQLISKAAETSRQATVSQATGTKQAQPTQSAKLSRSSGSKAQNKVNTAGTDGAKAKAAPKAASNTETVNKAAPKKALVKNTAATPRVHNENVNRTAARPAHSAAAPSVANVNRTSVNQNNAAGSMTGIVNNASQAAPRAGQHDFTAIAKARHEAMNRDQSHASISRTSMAAPKTGTANRSINRNTRSAARRIPTKASIDKARSEAMANMKSRPEVLTDNANKNPVLGAIASRKASEKRSKRTGLNALSIRSYSLDTSKMIGNVDRVNSEKAVNRNVNRNLNNVNKNVSKEVKKVPEVVNIHDGPGNDIYIIDGNNASRRANIHGLENIINNPDLEPMAAANVNRANPAVPVNPTAPVNPAVPVNPTAPVNPAVPVNPTAPVNPAVPVNPTAPVNPAVPVNPTAPVNPAVPVNPTAPVNPVNPGNNVPNNDGTRDSGKTYGRHKNRDKNALIRPVQIKDKNQLTRPVQTQDKNNIVPFRDKNNLNAPGGNKNDVTQPITIPGQINPQTPVTLPGNVPNRNDLTKPAPDQNTPGRNDLTRPVTGQKNPGRNGLTRPSRGASLINGSTAPAPAESPAPGNPSTAPR